MTPSLKGRVGLAVVCLLAIAVAGCGTSPTATEKSPAGGADSKGSAAALEKVYKEVKGLSGAERRKRLVELAKAEGGVLNLYCSMNGEEAQAVPAAFEEATGIRVERYRASSQDVMTRIIEEADANATASDVTCVNGSEAVVLDRKGLLAPLQVDVQGYPGEQVAGSYAWFYINAYAPMWNTKRIAHSDIPGSWEDVLSYDGRHALEVKAFDWFATLVEDYFMAERGMSQKEAVNLFRTAAKQAVLVDGNSVTGQLLSSGEFDLATAYSWIADDLAGDGAPVEWQPPVEPLVTRPNVVSILDGAAHPATALLYIEFALGKDEGQKILAKYGRTPAHPMVEGGLPEDVEVLPIDLEQMLDERKKWESLYEKVLRESDSKVRSE